MKVGQGLITNPSSADAQISVRLFGSKVPRKSDLKVRVRDSAKKARKVSDWDCEVTRLRDPNGIEVTCTHKRGAAWKPNNHERYTVTVEAKGKALGTFRAYCDPYGSPERVADAISTAASDVSTSVEVAHRKDRKTLGRFGTNALAFPIQTEDASLSGADADGGPSSAFTRETYEVAAELSAVIGTAFPTDPAALDVDALWSAVDQRIVPNGDGELVYKDAPVALIAASADQSGTHTLLATDSQRFITELRPLLLKDADLWKGVAASPKGSRWEVDYRRQDLGATLERIGELCGRPGRLVEASLEPEFDAALSNLARLGYLLGLHPKRRNPVGPNKSVVDQLARFRVKPALIDGPIAAAQAGAYAEIALRLVQWREEFTLARRHDPSDYGELTADFAQAVTEVRDAAFAWRKALDSVRITEAMRATLRIGPDNSGVSVSYLTETSAAIADSALRRARAAGRYGVAAAVDELELLHDQIVEHRGQIDDDELPDAFRQPRVTTALDVLIGALSTAIDAGNEVGG